MSAYESAVNLGFNGTEEEWLNSLKGADGVNGIDGKDGKDGESPRIDANNLHWFIGDTDTGYNAVPNVLDVPVLLSQLTNDTNFITNTVNNLINYYAKSEVYTKEEVSAIIGGMNQLKVSIVETLPTEDISNNTIYLVSSGDNIYDQHMYISGSWANLGNTSINLDGYVKTEDMQAALNGKASVDHTHTELHTHDNKSVLDYITSEMVLKWNNSFSGRYADWHIDAPANGGMVKLNLTVNYNFLSDRVTDLYTRFNGMDGESIVESKVQNSILAYVKEVTPMFSVMDIYSTKRAEVSSAITKYLNEKLCNEYGINISSALIIDVQLDDTLYGKIQAKEQAKQDAEKAELDKQTAIAVAEKEKEIAKRNAEKDKEVALIQAEQERQKAEIQAEQKMIQAQADASAVKIKADAEAEANRVVAASLTPELLQQIKYRQWDGKLPTVQGDNTPIIDLK